MPRLAVPSSIGWDNEMGSELQSSGKVTAAAASRSLAFLIHRRFNHVVAVPFAQVLDLGVHARVFEICAAPIWIYDSTFSVNVWGNK